MKTTLIVLGIVLAVLCFILLLQLVSGFQSVTFKDKKNRKILAFFWSNFALIIAVWSAISVVLVTYFGLCGSDAVLWGIVAILSGAIVVPIVIGLEFCIACLLIFLFQLFIFTFVGY